MAKNLRGKEYDYRMQEVFGICPVCVHFPEPPYKGSASCIHDNAVRALPKKEAAIERQLEHAKSSYVPSIVRHEDDGSTTDMTLVERCEINNLRQRVSDLEHALGGDAGWFDRAKNAERERDQLRLDMVEKHNIAKDLVRRHGDETCRLLAEIEAWKDASGLERGGDPDWEARR